MNHPLTYTRELVQTSFELPFVLFHLSVAVCITRQIVQRNNIFRTVFFKLYLAQTVTDVGSYLTYLILFRVIDLLPDFLRRNPWYAGLICVTQFFECLTYSLHVAIAANRYLVIAKPAAQCKFTKIRVIICCSLPPLASALFQLILPDCVSTEDKEECIRVAYTLSFFSSALYAGVATFATIFLDTRTFLAFKTLNKSRQQKGREDYYLLFYSMLQFTFVFAMAVMYTIIMLAIWTRNGTLVDAVFPYTWLNMSLISLSPPICLMFMSKKLQKEYTQLFFCRHIGATNATVVIMPPSSIQADTYVQQAKQLMSRFPHFCSMTELAGVQMKPLIIVALSTVAVMGVHSIAGPPSDGLVHARRKRQMVASPTRKWPIFDGANQLKIPFVFNESSLSRAYADVGKLKTLIYAALAFWEHNTCISFEEYASDAIAQSLSYVHFQADGGGTRSGDIGFISGKHICNIDPPGATFYTITHEIGHILGLYHEHVRNDRDNYVRIINTGSWANALATEDITGDKPYNFGSVMHYGHGDFWREMVATDRYKLYSATMGNRQDPTYWDLRHVSQAYGCPAYHESKCHDAHVTCGNNGYLHPNPAYCNVCVCPQGFAGTACEDLAHGDNGADAYCGHVVWATDAWQALSGEITGVDPNYTGPPACCYHHIKALSARQIEIRVDSIDAEMHSGGHWTSGDVRHEHDHCVWGSLEIVFENLTVSGAKICHQEDRDLFNRITYPIKSIGNVVLLKNCAHFGRVSFSVSYRIAPSPAGTSCGGRKRRAIDLHTNCAQMLKKYGSCSGHSYSKLMKVVCRRTCKTVNNGC